MGIRIFKTEKSPGVLRQWTPSGSWKRASVQSFSQPTVAVMTKDEVQNFRMRGLKIVHSHTLEDPRALPEAVKKAMMLSRTGNINMVVTGRNAVVIKDIPDNAAVVKPTIFGLPSTTRKKRAMARLAGKGPMMMSRSAGGPGKTSLVGAIRQVRVGKGEKVEIELQSEKDGTQVIVIITEEGQPIPDVRVKHVVRKRGTTVHVDDDKPKPKPMRFLKEGYDDTLIIEAMKKADKEMLNDEHKARLKYKDDEKYKFKMFNDGNLLVCLFYYIYINKLYHSETFWDGQRGHFHKFCKKHLPETFTLSSDSYFTRCIANLHTSCGGFEWYMETQGKLSRQRGKGEFDLPFWYELYRRASSYFQCVLK